MSIIQVRNLEKVYENEGARTMALRDASFDINAGEFVAIMGQSGSGKSTLLHILGFLDSPTGGEYMFKGVRAGDYSREDSARVRNKEMGFVFQSFNLLPKNTVLENVKLPLLYSTVPESQWEEYAQKSVDAVGLSHRTHHEASRLSGGEKQRVAIARALVNDPAIIFADEPTGNLDSASGQIVMEILERLAEEEKRTVILVTHETYTAEHAGRIIRMRDGAVESDKRVEHRHTARHFFKK